MVWDRHTVQLATLVIAAIGIATGIIRMRKCKSPAACYMATNEIFWLCHVCIFYVAVLIFNRADHLDMMGWSSIVRIHGVLTVITSMLARLRRE